jgi:hypothetical protein
MSHDPSAHALTQEQPAPALSKYQEFQARFVNHGQLHHTIAGECFEAIADLTQRMIDYSGWYADDVEYISLSHPIVPASPAKVRRFGRSGRNRERIREVASLVQGAWYLGIRFRLKPHVSVSFQPQEVQFVVPIWIKKDLAGNGDPVIQLKPHGRQYSLTEMETLIESVFQQIQQILEQGVQELMGVGDRQTELQSLGFVLS